MPAKMNPTIKTLRLPLQPNPNGIGSFTPTVEVVETTPDFHTTAGRVPSTWRAPIGKKLTNATIARYEREGWYGPTVQERASKRLNQQKHQRQTKGIVFRCKCGLADEVRFFTFSFLPYGPGYYCPRCLAEARRQRDMERELKQRYHEARMSEYE